MKKILAFVLLLAVFVGCEKKDPEVPVDNKEEEEVIDLVLSWEGRHLLQCRY